MELNNRILIVDDNKSIHEDFRKVLCTSDNQGHSELDDLERELFQANQTMDEGKKTSVEYEVDSAHQGREALEKVRAAEQAGKPYALVFMDVRMPPGWDGIETISRIWKEFPYVEMVICTAYSDYSWDDIVEKLGSTDRLLFLTKPFEAIVVKQMALTLIKKWNLSAQAREYVKKLETEVTERTKQLQFLLEELKIKNSELEHLALYDSLTQIPNRKLFLDRLSHRISTANRENDYFAVAILDLDRFKEINDTLGHLAGDKVLSEVAKRLTTQLRQSDTVSRLAGDEFAIILHSVNRNSTELTIEKLSTVFNTPFLVENESIDIGCSIGVAFYPEHGEDCDSLLSCADRAMYSAKREETAFVIYDQEEDSKRADNSLFFEELKSTVEAHRLSAYFQPVVSTVDGRVVSAEVLCRWNHPVSGVIPPDKFITIAEQKGLIHALTIDMLDKGLEQLVRWNQLGLDIGISVNLSTRNFLDPKFAGDLIGVIQKWNVDPSYLTLEITESMAMSDPERGQRILQVLTGTGVKIALDDFGTGASSLAYLRKFPISQVKLDKSFILNLDNNPSDLAITTSMINLVHSLGMTLVAEGVENKAILDMLQAKGCELVQGFYFSRPKPAEELTPWLLEQHKARKVS